MKGKGIYKNFRSSFHGLIDIPKIKKKEHLRKIVEAELLRRNDIPKPFYFSLVLPEDPSSPVPQGKASICVVGAEEVNSILEKDPSIPGIYTDEVAFSSFVSQKDKNPSYGIICYENEISIILFQSGIILYSTRIPRRTKDIGKPEVDTINSIIRYTMTIPRNPPSKIYIHCKGEEAVEGLILPVEAVDSFSIVEEEVKGYNLIPREFIETRLVSKYSTLFSVFAVSLSIIMLLYSLFLYKRIKANESYLARKKNEESILISTFRDYLTLKKTFQKNMGNVERYISIKSSFEPLISVASALKLISPRNVYIKRVVALKDYITISGTITGKSYSESYLTFLNLLQDMKKRFNLVSESFNPESKEFQLVFKGIQGKK